MLQVPCNIYGSEGWFWIHSGNRSASWTGAPNLRYYMRKYRGVVIDNPADSQVFMGSPCFYDWDFVGGYDDAYDHATICVGTNSAGRAIINSHNYDYFHYIFNYGGSVSTVQITRVNGGRPFRSVIDEPTPDEVVSGVDFNSQFHTVRVFDDGETATLSVRTIDGAWTDVYRFTNLGSSKTSYDYENMITGEKGTIGIDSYGYADPDQGFYAVWRHSDDKTNGLISELRMKNLTLDTSMSDVLVPRIQPNLNDFRFVDAVSGYSCMKAGMLENWCTPTRKTSRVCTIPWMLL